MMLGSRGYEVTDAASADEAIRLCAEGRVDLLITDTVMPGDDGSRLARAATEHLPGLPVLQISGYTPQSAGQFDLDGSETAFLHKPFSTDDLVHHVRDLLDRASRTSAT
jgi:CheY-like chemotaxis protein